MDTEDRDHFRTIARASVAPLATSASASSAARNLSSRHDQAYLAQKVELIFSCYRKDEAHDPRTYAQAMMLVLSDYPRSVIDHVIDPRTGILGVSKFLPSVSEIKEACENAFRRICQDDERERRIVKQLADRDSDYLSDNPARAARRKAFADAWLNRVDAQAQELSGTKPKVPLTEDEKRALLDSARATTARLNAGEFQLSEETKAIMRNQDALRDHLTLDDNADS